MNRVRFIAPARREFLSEVAYYNGKELGLGARFTAAVEEATTRAIAFPLAGSPASKSTRHVFVRNFPFAMCTVPMQTASSSSRLHIIRVGQSTGSHAFKTANKFVRADVRGARGSTMALDCWGATYAR